METRKLREKEWSDERFKDLESLTSHDYEKKHSNMKFYSVTRSSKQFIEKLLRLHTNNSMCLDYCCGTGAHALEMGLMAKKVYGIDISPEGIKVSNDNARKAGMTDKVEFLVMDAEHTDFPDNYFDLITCFGVLHHLDIKRAYNELSRILKPTGVVICVEPLKYNPVFQFYRRKTSHLRTEWERDHILGMEQIELARGYFGNLDIRFFHLVSLAAVPLRNTSAFDPVLFIFEILDDIILRIPYLQRLAWQTVFQLRTPN